MVEVTAMMASSLSTIYTPHAPLLYNAMLHSTTPTPSSNLQRHMLEPQPRPQHGPVPHHGRKPHQIRHTAHRMQHRKPPIQPLHSLTMRALVVRGLPIPRLLMLPLDHDPRGLRTHVDQVRSGGDKHGGQQAGGEAVGGGLQDAGGGEGGHEARGAGWVGCEEGQGREGLQGEEDGKGGFLEGAELRAWEHAVGDYARDEGLEEGAAEEGAVAGGGRRVSLCSWWGGK